MVQATSLLLAYAATDLVACLIPGPAVMTVISLSLTGTKRTVAAGIAGLNTANVIWYLMVGMGLLALVHTAPTAFAVLRWAGIAYLFRLGIQTWRSHMHFEVDDRKKAMSPGRGFTSAMAVQLSNPKALLFFTIFLPPFIDLRHPVAPQLLTLAAIGIALEVSVLAGYSALAFKLKSLSVSAAADRWFARVSGAIFIVIGAAMAISHAT